MQTQWYHLNMLYVLCLKHVQQIKVNSHSNLTDIVFFYSRIFALYCCFLLRAQSSFKSTVLA